MSVNSKMTAIADAIRAKTGGTGLLTLDDMAQDIAAIDTSENLDEVLDEQESLIDQIQVALEGKAAGGGGEISSLIIEDRGFGWSYPVYFVDVNGQFFTEDTIQLDTIYSVPKFSLVVMTYGGGGGVHATEGLTQIGSAGVSSSGGVIYQITESAAKLYVDI